MVGIRSFIAAIGLFVWVTNVCANVTPKDCTELRHVHSPSGVYTIYPDRAMQTGFQVSCDMDVDGGGWTVIQRRVSDSDFFKTWNEYRKGFGDLANNFWLGNKKISMITSQGCYELRIDLVSTDGEKRYAKYEVFSVGDAKSKYKLFVDGYTGNANDGMAHSNEAKFSTKDRDNDNDAGSCAQKYKGGWWYNSCHDANLNGDYGNTQYGQGINWEHWLGKRVSLARADMKIRRTI